MQVPFVDLATQHSELRHEFQQAFAELLDSCQFVDGPDVAAFEDEFAEYCGVEHCVGVGSGTAALEIVLRARQIGPGDEVIVPANSFVATAEAVALVGATPVFVDVREDTANIDLQQIDQAITPATRAIIPVHLFGQPADMGPLMQLAGRHRLFVVEDASQSQGARWQGRMVGSLADAAAFSFYPAKNLGACGEAGAVTTNDRELADRVRMIRQHGGLTKNHHEILGRNDRLDSLQASLLRIKLRYLDQWNRQRQEHASSYMAAFAGRREIGLFATPPECQSVHHLFVVRVKDRDHVAEQLANAGVATAIHYPTPIPFQPAFRAGHSDGQFPVAERLANEILSLPLSPHFTGAQIEYVASTLLDVVSNR